MPFKAVEAKIHNVWLALKDAYMSLPLSIDLTKHEYHCLDIYLQAEEAAIMRCSDSRWGLEPFAGFPQQVAQRPDGWDREGAGDTSQNQHVVTPPAHIHQRVVLLLIWDR